jgi:hypothetical protein
VISPPTIHEPEFPQESFPCDESRHDILTVAHSDYDPDAVYVTASESNSAGVMTHHIGFFLNPVKAVALGERLIAEAVSKVKGR